MELETDESKIGRTYTTKFNVPDDGFAADAELMRDAATDALLEAYPEIATALDLDSVTWREPLTDAKIDGFRIYIALGRALPADPSLVLPADLAHVNTVASPLLPAPRLPPFTHQPLCRKCHGTTAVSKWVASWEARRDDARSSGYVSVDVFATSPSKPEHIERRCVECGFTWDEAPLDRGAP